MDKQQAVVLGASLVAFLPGMPQQQRDSVKLALALAERATRSAFDEGMVKDWLSYYRNQLRFYGWDAVPPQEAHWPSVERPAIVDRALSTIAAKSNDRFAEATGVALQRLTADADTLLQFEGYARTHGHFQLLPCASSSATRVDMVIYHETGSRSLFTAGFLSRDQRAQNVRAELVRFNTLLFDQQHRPRVQKTLLEVALRNLTEYDL